MSSPVARKGSLLRTVQAVAWSFVGIRKNSDYQEDLVKLNPLHIIFVGLAGALLVVLGLMLLVNWVVK
jgi:amino acid transporter